MGSIQGKTALVTGASSGIGKSTVIQLLEAGARVYAAARRMEEMADLEARGARLIRMDVTDQESMTEGMARIRREGETVDILVNNAGYGSYGAVESVPLEEARRQFEVNLFGMAALIQLVLPGMREKGYGKIVNISSIGGKMYTPFGGWYHAAKHAVEGLSDCLRLETAPFGIDTIIIEPGTIGTPWGAIAAENLRKTSLNGPYRDAAGEAADRLAARYSSPGLTSPEVLGKAIRKAVTARRPRTRYAVGRYSFFALFIRRWGSDRLFDKLVQSML